MVKVRSCVVVIELADHKGGQVDFGTLENDRL